MGMIKSILDTDLYKFTVSYAYQKLYPEAEGTFTFNDRDHEVYGADFIELLKSEITGMSRLKLTDEELSWCIENIKFVPSIYWEWLETFRFEPSKIKINLDDEGHLHINVTDNLYKVTLYEVPLLFIVSESRNRYFGWTEKLNMDDVISTLRPKIELSNENRLFFSEFGARRRFSFDVQDKVCEYLKENAVCCTGTSNVFLAKKYDMRPMGTHPHEWFMFHGAVFGYKKANEISLRDWSRVYDGDLGIALCDAYTTRSFLDTLTMKFAKLFDGMRQDSGNEITVGNMIIDRYRQFGIDPTTKTVVFSNALDFPRYKEVADYFKGKIRVSAGIGTNLTNDPDIKDYVPCNIVMKLMHCRERHEDRWTDCIKISDDDEKAMGNPREIEICKYELGIS
jgi:nicotinate phosphoribosyltransferase